MHPDTFNFGADVVDRFAAGADKEALICCNAAGEETRYRFSDMAEASARLASSLQRLGLSRGDRVVIMCPV